MPLDVLIATPSGPFGELIRLTLEADPEFHCSIVDNGIEIRGILQEGHFQAVIFDCSFVQPDPGQMIARIKDEFPSVTLLLVPPENRADMAPLQNCSADGLITRPFDASVVPELVKAAIQKKQQQPEPGKLPEPLQKSTSWWNAFQSGIRETAASSGMIVQNGLVVACTPDTSTALQQQVTASVMRFWNPADSSDLMRYVKDLVTGQEWMMYASQAADNAVLVLLFQPQTPVTRVRSQTLKLAKEISPLMVKPAVLPPQHEAGYLESAEPPRLHEILGEKAEEGTPRIVKNGFPVEWFKEADLPEFNSSKLINEEAPMADSSPIRESSSDETPSIEPADQIDPVFNPIDFGDQSFKAPLPDVESDTISDIPAQQTALEPAIEKELPELITEEPTGMAPEAAPQSDELDLGIFQPVNLLSQYNEENGLDSIQPIQLETKKPVDTPETFIPEIRTELESSAVPTVPEEITQPLAGVEKEPLSPLETEPEMQLLETSEPMAKEPGDLPEYSEIAATPDELNTVSDFQEVLNTAAVFGEQDATDNLDAAEIQENQPEVKDDFGAAYPEPIEKEEPVPFASQFEPVDMISEEILPDSTAMEEVSIIESEPPADQEMPLEPAVTGDNLFNRMNQLETPASEENVETYTVALIPQAETMILQRQIAGLLNQTLSRLCLAFNWKLNNLTIRPTYMQWTVTIPVSLSPDDMIGIVRKETTQEIIKNGIDNLMLGNQEDFWASESMSAAGKDFIPSNRWQDFILRRKTHEIA